MPPRRVLLDECVDWRLGEKLAGHEVKTASASGWAGLSNGDLLRRAQAEFDILITTDRNLMFQQNLPEFDIAMIVLAAKSDRLNDLLVLVPKILAAIPSAKPGEPIILQG